MRHTTKLHRYARAYLTAGERYDAFVAGGPTTGLPRQRAIAHALRRDGVEPPVCDDEQVRIVEVALDRLREEWPSMTLEELLRAPGFSDRLRAVMKGLRPADLEPEEEGAGRLDARHRAAHRRRVEARARAAADEDPWGQESTRYAHLGVEANAVALGAQRRWREGRREGWLDAIPCDRYVRRAVRKAQHEE